MDATDAKTAYFQNEKLTTVLNRSYLATIPNAEDKEIFAADFAAKGVTVGV